MDLHSLLDLFGSIAPEERLELLIDYGHRLAPLESEYVALRDSGAHIVHECQAPVFFLVEVNSTTLHIEVDAPEEAAIARGFSALLKELFDGTTVPPDEEVPDNMLSALHIESILGMQRRRGLGAIYKKLKEGLSK